MFVQEVLKWISNSKVVLNSIPEIEKAKEVKNLDLDIDGLPIERTLGVQWCAGEDTFKFQVSVKAQPCTRRGIISMVSSVYDPFGCIAPFTLPAKHILQELCKHNFGWDQEIPKTCVEVWRRWLLGLERISEFKINTCFKPMNFGHVKSAQIHHFCDASEIGYGTVTYLRLTNGKGDVHVAFVTMKLITIPRMELTAAVLCMCVQIECCQRSCKYHWKKSVFWTDSTTVFKVHFE